MAWATRVLLPFAATRAVVAGGLLLGSRVLPAGTPPASFWHPAWPALEPFIRFDAHYYLAIATWGYGPAPAPVPAAAYRSAFFPGYPVAIALVHRAGVDASVAALLVSNLAFLAAVACLDVLFRRRSGEAAARSAIWLLCCFPWSFFFSVPYSESLFLLLAAASFLLCEHGRAVPAGLAAAAAALTRGPGAVLGPAFLAEAALGSRRWDRRLVVAGLIGAAGSAADLYFLRSQSLWQGSLRNPLFPLAVLGRAVIHLDVGNSQALGLPVLVAFGVAGVWVLWRLPLSYGVYVAGIWVLSAWHGWTIDQFYSVPRFLMTAFPCFLWLPAVTAGTRARLLPMVLATVSTPLLALYSAEYATWHFVG